MHGYERLFRVYYITANKIVLPVVGTGNKLKFQFLLIDLRVLIGPYPKFY